MFIVTVNFVIKEEKVDEFEVVMKQQAYNSLHHEKGCLQFDVCVDPKDRRRVFLYEVYQSRGAFDIHLETEHFLNFDRTVKDWMETKVAETWERFEPE
jgi:autoinducer 2-degrading protein